MRFERFVILAGATTLWSGLWGCGKTEEPIVVYEPEIGLADIARTSLEVKANAYHLLNPDQTMGRFPGAIAVARLKLSDEKHRTDGNVVALKSLNGPEAAYWNHLYDNLPSVRSWFELRDFDVPPGKMTAERLVQAAGRLHATLCLLYGQNEIDGDTKLVGVLYDTRSTKPIATLHAQCTGVNDWPNARPEGRHEDDYRHQDNTYLASRKFERFAYDCVVQLIGTDKPERIEKPDGWIITEPNPELYQKIK
jgi:hypothetical protein